MRVLIRDNEGILTAIEVHVASYVEEEFDNTVIRAVTMVCADASAMIAVYVDSEEEGEQLLTDFAKEGFIDLSNDDRAQLEMFNDMCDCDDHDCDCEHHECGCDHDHQ